MMMTFDPESYFCTFHYYMQLLRHERQRAGLSSPGTRRGWSDYYCYKPNDK